MKKPTEPAKAAAKPAARTPPKPATQGEASSAAPQGLSPTAAAQKISLAFGQIVNLMLRSQSHRTHFIAELEWMLVPAVATGQYMISEFRETPGAAPMPVAAVLWARVSPAIDQRLQASKQLPKLAPNEWASGDIPWLVDAFGDPKAATKLVKHLAENIFPNGGLRAVQRGADGKAMVRIMGKSANMTRN